MLWTWSNLDLGKAAQGGVSSTPPKEPGTSHCPVHRFLAPALFRPYPWHCEYEHVQHCHGHEQVHVQKYMHEVDCLFCLVSGTLQTRSNVVSFFGNWTSRVSFLHRTPKMCPHEKHDLSEPPQWLFSSWFPLHHMLRVHLLSLLAAVSGCGWGVQIQRVGRRGAHVLLALCRPSLSFALLHSPTGSADSREFCSKEVLNCMKAPGS